MSALRLLNEYDVVGVNEFKMEDIFTDDFAVYKIQVPKLHSNSSGFHLYGRFIDNTNSVVSSASYRYASQEIHSYDTTVTERRDTNATAFEYFGYSNDVYRQTGLDITVYSPTSTSNNKMVFINTSGQYISGQITHRFGGALMNTATPMTGFLLSPIGLPTTFSADIKVYGIKE